MGDKNGLGVKEFYNPFRDGVTQSLLTMFKRCRQETRLYLQGWTPKRQTSSAIIFGTIVHGVLERIYNDVRLSKIKVCPNSKYLDMAISLSEKQFKTVNGTVDNATLQLLEYNCALTQATLPGYFKKWWKHDCLKIRWKAVEQEFNVPIILKDGRKICLRGKRDGAFVNPKLWLFETKTKSVISEEALLDTLPLDFQNLTYLLAMQKEYKTMPAGVLYNVIRNTSLKLKKNESLPSFVSRVREDIAERPDFYFVRYEVAISLQEIQEHNIELQNLVSEFVAWWEGKLGHYKSSANCLTKYGRCSMLPICSQNTYVWHQKRKKLFNELSEL